LKGVAAELQADGGARLSPWQEKATAAEGGRYEGKKGGRAERAI
jgi:hypothetical protein